MWRTQIEAIRLKDDLDKCSHPGALPSIIGVGKKLVAKKNCILEDQIKFFQEKVPEMAQNIRGLKNYATLRQSAMEVRYRVKHIHSFFYKSTFYKNTEAQI